MVVYLTDGGAPLPDIKLRANIPVLWLITSRGHLPGFWYSRGAMEIGRLYGVSEGLEYGSAIKLPARL